MDNLETKLGEYVAIKTQIEQLEAQKEKLAEEIKAELRTANDQKFEGVNYKAAIVNKTMFKYTDEAAVLMYAKKYNLKNYIKETINTKVLNEDLKKGGALAQNLKDYYTKTLNESLTVGEVK